MSFIRRLFGRQRGTPVDEPRLRRAAHVTRRNNQPLHPPADEAVPAPPPAAQIDESSPEPTQAAETNEQPEPQTTKTPPENPEPLPQPAPRRAVPEPPITETAPSRQPNPSQQQPLTYGIASHVGMLRTNNEDACFGMHWHSITVDERPGFGFFIVADGMGGHLDGERAAGIAVQTLAAEMVQRVHRPLLRNAKASSSPTILDSLVSAAERANLAVVQHVPGGGTTLSAVAIVGSLAYLAHVGDSRAYLIHGEII
ncbi:MAG: protein phosphatase 2C domain-containing protein, partial [Chloroflexi bacterium]|nr:protein phosphatase 2C domain-containing protein [Chloroflexota bacterium]